MTEFKNIHIDKAGGVAKVTLDRPKHNVLNLAMMDELSGAMEQLAGDDALKCVVIYGNGPSWCAGVEVADHKPGVVHTMIAGFNRIFFAMEKIEIPIIAAVHGFCLGGGMEVAIACDIIMASENAFFGQPEIKLGFFPPYAAVRLPQLVGPAKAIEICTTGKRYTAKAFREIGLVTAIADEDKFQSEVDKLVGEITACSPLIIRLNKRAVKQHLGMGFEDAMERVSELFLHKLMKTQDTLEGIASFEEKRKPVWKNR